MEFKSITRSSLSKIAKAKSVYRSFSVYSSRFPSDLSSSRTRTSASALLKGLEKDDDIPPSIARPRTPPGGTNLHAASLNLAKEIGSNRRNQSLADRTRDAVDKAAKLARIKDLERQQTRRWQQGDVYAPHDLSPIEMRKFRKRTNPDVDVFDVLGINPLDEWKNFAMMSEFTTSMGRIKHSNITGLRNVNQRRIAKAIKRAIGMGFLPSVHRHPEMLRRERR
ncbi:hypothetical protein MMC09_006549 [Bachmanniomyces sp. S44760]|nr:hypothetical protein [Bachmanniomyces sp. S44760]